LTIDGVMKDHTIIQVQYSNGDNLTACVTASDEQQCKQMVCLEQRENCFRFNLRVFANNKLKLHYV